MQQDITLLAPPLSVQPPAKAVALPPPPKPLPSGRIDLHGLTETQAHAQLQAAIAQALREGRKKLLVITGKGSGQQGALKRNVPRWLELIPQVTGCQTASPREGGEGALIVRLKVNR
jgi:DNA-nicking Smr family endonuclease